MRLSFADDPAWNKILLHPQQKKAIVLVTSHDELVYRVKMRKVIEDSVPGLQPAHEYDSCYWLSIYSQVDLLEVYAQWCRELKRSNIEYTLIDSTTSEYSVIESVG